MESILSVYIKLVDELQDLHNLTSLLYSLYVQRNEESNQRYTYPVPELGSDYEASAEVKFNSEFQTPIVHKRCYREMGSRGGYMFYVNNFKFEEAKFELEKIHSDFKIEIECPASDLNFISVFTECLNKGNLTVRTDLKVESFSIIKGLTSKYFCKVLDNISYLAESFELSRDYKSPILEVNDKNRKEVLFTSIDETTQIKVVFWRSFQPEFNRNYSGLLVQIDQSKNPIMPKSLNFTFHHHDAHAFGQVDLTVDRCTLEARQNPERLEIQTIEIAFRAYLLGLGLL